MWPFETRYPLDYKEKKLDQRIEDFNLSPLNFRGRTFEDKLSKDPLYKDSYIVGPVPDVNVFKTRKVIRAGEFECWGAIFLCKTKRLTIKIKIDRPNPINFVRFKVKDLEKDPSCPFDSSDFQVLVDNGVHDEQEDYFYCGGPLIIREASSLFTFYKEDNSSLYLKVEFQALAEEGTRSMSYDVSVLRDIKTL